MKQVIDLFSRTRPLALAIMAASAGILTVAYISQYVFHYDPCILCLYQRKPYFAAIALAAAAWLFDRSGRGKMARGFIMLCGLAFMTGMGIAGYHNGVEQGWWQGTQACADAGLPATANVEELREYLLNRRIVSCDVPIWKLFGFSMTAYNLLASTILAIFTFVFLHRSCPGCAKKNAK